MPGKEKLCIRLSKLELETEVAYLQSIISYLALKNTENVVRNLQDDIRRMEGLNEA